MTDPVFGNLEYEYGWNKTVDLNCFGRVEKLNLTVSGEEDAPVTDMQRDSFTAFIGAWDRLRNELPEAVKNYYMGLRKELGYDREFNAYFPPIEHATDILKMISLDLIVIPEDGIFDGRCVCLAFSCTWDEENGMGIRLLDEEIDEIGSQDLAF